MIEISVLKIDMESLLREVNEFSKRLEHQETDFRFQLVFFNFIPLMEKEHKNYTVKHLCRNFNHL